MLAAWILVRELHILGSEDILGHALILKGLKTSGDPVIRKTEFKGLEEGLLRHEVHRFLLMSRYHQLSQLLGRLGHTLAVLFMLFPSLSNPFGRALLEVLVDVELTL